MVTKDKIAGIVLAGGMSRRMGTDKAFLKVGTQTFLEKAVSSLTELTSEVFISGSRSDVADFDAIVVPDVFPGKGPLAGIFSVMKQADYSYYFVLPVDLPLVSKDLIKFLISRHSEDYDITVPVFKNKLHPLLGVFSNSIKEVLLQCLEEDKLKVKDLLDSVSTNYADVSFRFSEQEFANINTPDELNLWIKE